jgi:4'-phosphopantetheinyl transferase EntD
MIERLLPPPVVAVEAFSDVPGEPVFPGEEDLVAKAVAKRRQEFVTARRCAREALERLGHPPAPIRSGPAREPLWPAGVVGSITHCDGYRAAAVAPAAEVTSFGIDAEPHGPLPDGVADAVTVAAEREMLDALTAVHPGVHWGRLLFSAKESIYKAWYPVHRRWLGFTDVRLSIDPVGGTFTADRLPGLQGRFLVDRGLIVTSAVY